MRKVGVKGKVKGAHFVHTGVYRANCQNPEDLLGSNLQTEKLMLECSLIQK